jgi:hypothetical protein
MNEDVILDLPEDEGPPAHRYHESVPEWPMWAKGRSTYGGGRLAVPYFVSQYGGRDYVIQQGVDWRDSGEVPILSQRVVLYELVREPPEAEWPWTWRGRLDDVPHLPDAREIDYRLALARQLLPKLIRVAELSDDVSDSQDVDPSQ